MELVIHSVGLWGHPNIRTWEPDDPTAVAEVLFLQIGPRAAKSSKRDTFELRLATPKGLGTLEAKDGILAMSPLLILDRYDFDDLWRWLVETVARCEADTWVACVEKLRRHFRWEYDEYREL